MSPPVLEAARSRLASALQAQGAQVAQPGADQTANARQIVHEEIFNVADDIESYVICLKEAARRGDEARMHDYFADIVRCGAELRSADERLSVLARLGGGK
jgi:hypothetical protein